MVRLRNQLLGATGGVLEIVRVVGRDVLIRGNR